VIFSLLLHYVIFHIVSKKWGYYVVSLTAPPRVREPTPRPRCCCGFFLWFLINAAQTSLV